MQALDTSHLFGGTLPVLERGLDVRGTRHSLLMSNITNADTPFYKAFDVALREEMESPQAPEAIVPCAVTHPRHLMGTQDMDPSFKVVEKKVTHFTMRKDENTVDLEREMADLAHNTTTYDAVALLLARKFQGLKSAIQGERR